MTQNSIRWWGSCSGDQQTLETPIITITPRSPITRSGITCKEPIYRSNKSVYSWVIDCALWYINLLDYLMQNCSYTYVCVRVYDLQTIALKVKLFINKPEPICLHIVKRFEI